MENKRLVLLVILSVVAVFSIIYGLFAPTKLKRELTSIANLVHKTPSVTIEEITLAKRLTKRTNYTSWGRSPFVRSKTPIRIATTLTLNGIVWDDKNPKAIINDDILGVGDEVSGNVIIEIKQDRVVLNDGVRNFELTLGQ